MTTYEIIGTILAVAIMLMIGLTFWRMSQDK
jgi:hypothetical protein